MTHNTDPIKTIEEILDLFYARRKQEWDKLDLGMIGNDTFKANCKVVTKEATQAINNELLRARISELMEMPKTSDYVIARHLAERITKLEAAIKSSGGVTPPIQQSQTEDPNTSNEVRG